METGLHKFHLEHVMDHEKIGTLFASVTIGRYVFQNKILFSFQKGIFFFVTQFPFYLKKLSKSKFVLIN